MTLDQWLKLAQILAAIVFGVAAVIVSSQQLKVSKSKQRLELYDRRKAILSVLTEYVSLALHSSEFSSKDVAEFRSKTSESKFLFGPDINTELDQFFRIGMSLENQNSIMREISLGNREEHSTKNPVRARLALVREMSSRYEDFIETIGKYLDLKT